LLQLSLDQARDEAAHWRQQAETMTRLLDQQQQLSLPDRMKDLPALTDGSDQAPTGKVRRFLFWRW